jgi:hypothetical protein
VPDFSQYPPVGSEPGAMRRPLAGDDGIVATCVGRQNGAVVKSKSERDSVCAVFAMIADATAAATGPPALSLR